MILKVVNSLKENKVEPDENGFYKFALGTIDDRESLDSFFNEDSKFIKSVRSGLVYGELGQPKKSETEDFMTALKRYRTVDMEHACCQIKDVWLDKVFKSPAEEQVYPYITTIMGLIKPTDTKNGNYLSDAILNEADISFYPRAMMTAGIVKGNMVQKLSEIITFDVVEVRHNSIDEV